MFLTDVNVLDRSGNGIGAINLNILFTDGDENNVVAGALSSPKLQLYLP